VSKTSEITLHRRYLKPEYTIGVLSVDGVYLCETVEDAVRDFNKDGDLLDEDEEKVYGKTAIPYGRYRVTVNMSPKFKRELPIILDVPHFTGIRIHEGKNANWSEGCVILGENKVKGGVINSAPYVKELTSWIKIQEGLGNKVYINII
jgi:hypothetical protein